MTETAPDPRRWRALAVCFVGGFVTMLDVSIVNVTLPSMQAALRAGATELQLIVAGYSLAFGLVLVPAGRVGDARGRRRLFMTAMAGFGLTSLLAGLAQTDWQLAACRLFQGCFAGLSSPQVSGLIQQLFRGRERSRAFGLFGGVIGVSTALGPLVGGLLLAAFGTTHGWRWVFFINVPICLAVLPLAKRLLPGPPATAGRSQRLDPVGLGLVGFGTMAFMAPFVLTPQGGFFDDPARWQWLAGAAALLPLTYFWERSYQRRHGAAVLNFDLLGQSSFRFGAALGAVYFAGFTALFLIVSMMLQSGLGFSALTAGLVVVPNAIGSGTMAALSGRLVSRFGRRLVVAGLTTALVGMILVDSAIRFAPAAWLPWAVAAAMFVSGLGNGCIISPNQVLTFEAVPPALGGVAGAVLQVGQRVGAAVGTAVVLSIYFTTFASQTSKIGAGPASERAASAGLLVSAGIIAAALVIAVFDARRRRAQAAVA
ncbi:MAG: MFS transporter [Propionibacteriaceae bacterium]|jgi:MFS family permease|nr:MFS transporter [Propionibacteriaceae bacterium]